MFVSPASKVLPKRALLRRNDLENKVNEHDKLPPSKRVRGFFLRQLTQDPNVAAPHEIRRTNDEIHSNIDLCPVSVALIDSPQFQRLRGISQLGMTSMIYMNANHTRFEHSIGVSYLAERLCRRIKDKQPSLGCSERDVLCVKLAGLLHDIGHGPLSHVWEKFTLHVFPKRLAQIRAQRPDLYKRYEDMPEIPPGWRHESASLLMIDAVLEHLGLQIDLENLDKPLAQIGDGVDAKAMRVFDSALTEADVVLTSRDFVFIKECIWGGPIPEVCQFFNLAANQFVGRQEPHKVWLYDVVSNRHSGLDVDKVDYFSRDERRCFGEAGEIDRIVMEDAYVARVMRTNATDGEHPEHVMICYPAKRPSACFEFFKKRYSLHSKVYQNKTTVAAEYMMCDIFALADPFFELASSNGQKLSLSRAMLDPSAFVDLRDSVIDIIASSPDPNMEPARALIRRLRCRDLYKCVATIRLKMSDATHQRMWAFSEEDITKEMLRIDGTHDDQNGDKIHLTENDFIIDRCSVHYGCKDRSPLSRLRFFAKDESSKLTAPMESLPVAQEVDESDYDSELPKSFQNNSIRVFSVHEFKNGLVKHVFSEWLNSHVTTPDGADAAGAAMLTQESPTTPKDPAEAAGKKNNFKSKQCASKTKMTKPSTTDSKTKEATSDDNSSMDVDSSKPAALFSVLIPEKTEELFSLIKKLVTHCAEEERLMGKSVFYWNILSNDAMKHIASRVPTTVDELKAMGYLSKNIVKEYGDRIVGVVKTFLDNNGIPAESKRPAKAAGITARQSKTGPTVYNVDDDDDEDDQYGMEEVDISSVPLP